jgi:AraC-like DNA-binding protein
MVRGSAWLSVDNTSEPDIALSGGDLAVLPLGHAHVLRDHPRSAPVHVDQVAQCGSRSLVMQLEVGAKGPETTFITGAFVLDDPLARQILAVLPPVIRMRPEVEEEVPSFLDNIQFITREVEGDRPGSELVLLRMADVIFIQILRAYLARVPAAVGGGFLGALRDPSTAAALGAMHQRPESPWTVASLAKEVGLSRSVFAARFTQLVGEPPLGYLTRLRMQKAATLLREGASLAKISQLTGYASEASFSHAFRQWAGVAPGAYRKTLRESSPDAD